MEKIISTEVALEEIDEAVEMGMLPKGDKTSATLASAAYHPPLKMCAMHLLSMFMNELVKKIQPIGGRTLLEDKGLSSSGKGYVLKLQNSILTQLAQNVAQSELCSREEAHLTMVSVLSVGGKLPKVDVIVKYAHLPLYSQHGNLYN